MELILKTSYLRVQDRQVLLHKVILVLIQYMDCILVLLQLSIFEVCPQLTLKNI